MGNKELIRKLRRDSILRSERIKKAMQAADRIEFVPDHLRHLAYEDIPLPIGQGQTISQPGTVVFMLELLSISEGDKILEVGGGSGWVTALMSSLTGKKGFIWSYEIDQEVGRFGLANLAKFRKENYQYIIADAKENWSHNAPYDRIIAGAALPYVYEELVKLIKKGGSIVVPTQNFEIKRITRSPNTGDINQETYFGFVFVPLK